MGLTVFDAIPRTLRVQLQAQGTSANRFGRSEDQNQINTWFSSTCENNNFQPRGLNLPRGYSPLPFGELGSGQANVRASSVRR